MHTCGVYLRSVHIKGDDDTSLPIKNNLFKPIVRIFRSGAVADSSAGTVESIFTHYKTPHE